jgi:hypothetical protein
MSYDPEAFFHPGAAPVELDHYLPDLLAPPQKEVSDETPPNKPGRQGPRAMPGPTDGTLEKIRQKLNPGRRKPKTRQTIFQPEAISTAVEYFEENLAEYELSLVASEAISYGRRLRIAGPRDIWCELKPLLR